MLNPRIMIVTGEASGDLHGARLVAALKKMRPDVEVCGMGGPELAGQGVEILYDAARIAVIGLVEVFGHLADIRKAMTILEKRLRDQQPDLLILVDLPDFNCILGKKAKKLGIPILYYISPQIWAWRTGRVKKIKKIVDRMAVILPFEQDFYARHGVAVDFVGHPLLDSVRAGQSKEAFLKRHGIPANKTLVSLLPGSRKKEIAAMLPLFLAAGKLLARRDRDIVFLLPLAPTLSREILAQSGLAGTDLDVRVLDTDRYDLMAASDAAVAASGTVTLELAILGVPMIVSYRVSPLTYFLGRRLIKVQYASLVNLVADREVVPELLQHDAVPGKIAAVVDKLLHDAEYGKTMRAELGEVRSRLGGPGASKRAAGIALEMIQSSQG